MHSSDFSKYTNFYNYTSTYRIDSDFPQFYQTDQNFVWKENKGFDANFDFSNGKTDLAAAVISNCHAPSRNYFICIVV